MMAPDASSTVRRVGRLVAGVDHARGGLTVDVILYAAGALFAGLTAANATLLPHRAWGRIAVIGYAVAALIAIVQAVSARRRGLAGTPARALVTVATFVATAVAPMIVEAVGRAGGRLDRAQEEVGVVEAGGVRLWHTGTPYLSHDAIAVLPPGQRLDAYLPYQPGMAVYGLPKALFGTAWWTDARVWFTVTLIVTIGWAVRLLRVPGGTRDAALVRAVQAATVFPICALTIATGGDDMPVLGLSLLAFAFAARGRHGAAGLAIGLAGSLKLFAWPVALVLIALAAATGAGRADAVATLLGRSADLHGAQSRRDRAMRSRHRSADLRAAARCAAGAIGLPILVLIPAFAVNRDAAIENVVRFPLGHGIVQSPAASPFPGHLIASDVPAGHTLATLLLAVAAIAIGGWLVWRPPRDAGAAAGIAAWGLLAAILVIPSTRFGYLLYPVAYACWVPALRPVPATTGAATTTEGKPSESSLDNQLSSSREPPSA